MFSDGFLVKTRENWGKKGRKESDREWACRSAAGAHAGFWETGSRSLPAGDRAADRLTGGARCPRSLGRGGHVRRLSPAQRNNAFQGIGVLPVATGSRLRNQPPLAFHLSQSAAFPRGAGCSSPPPVHSPYGPSGLRLGHGDPMGVPVAATLPKTSGHQGEAGLSDWGWVGTQGGPEGSQHQEPQPPSGHAYSSQA